MLVAFFTFTHARALWVNTIMVHPNRSHGVYVRVYDRAGGVTEGLKVESVTG